MHRVHFRYVSDMPDMETYLENLGIFGTFLHVSHHFMYIPQPLLLLFCRKLSVCVCLFTGQAGADGKKNTCKMPHCRGTTYISVL